MIPFTRVLLESVLGPQPNGQPRACVSSFFRRVAELDQLRGLAVLRAAQLPGLRHERPAALATPREADLELDQPGARRASGFGAWGLRAWGLGAWGLGA